MQIIDYGIHGNMYQYLYMLASPFSVPGDDSQMLLRQWESVLREGTATPSESQGGGATSGKGRDGSGEGDTEQKGCGDGTTPENQQDANSEPEAPNDSSGEEESG